MNQIRLLAFAQARDALGFAERMLEVSMGDTPRMLLQRLLPEQDFSLWRVALDCEYAAWDSPIAGCAELALVPPVSGG